MKVSLKWLRKGAVIFQICLWVVLCISPLSLSPAQATAKPETVVNAWHQLILKLVRHTPTYSPPVASRAFAYFGVTAYEATVSGRPDMVTMAGQLNGLTTLPKREAGQTYDDAIVLNHALTVVAKDLFSNTGPTGQRVLEKFSEKQATDVSSDVSTEVIMRSQAYGQVLAEHILTWSRADGGAVVNNMGFAEDYKLVDMPGHWVPTSAISQQQRPLLATWGQNRSFAMPNGGTCQLPPPPAYSEEKTSAFYREAIEVYDVVKKLSPEQKAIARFWSDDPMLSPTPPGHWLSIALDIFERDKLPVEKQVDLLMRLGVAMADGFIGCWHSKFYYDLLRPITYIKKNVDPKWEPLLITPPFPEYPSGHSTQSGAAATVLTAMLGDHFAFDDNTHIRDGLAARHFDSFWAAAEEAGISRLYGGIHFRSAIDQGLQQGRCIGAFAVALKTRK